MFPKFKRILFGAILAHPWLRRRLNRTIRGLRARRYSKLKAGPINQKKIVFESFMGRRYSGSPRAVYEHIIGREEFHDWEFIWGIRGPRTIFEDILLLQDSRTKTVNVLSSDYARHLKEAKWWISNSIMPQHIAPTPEQVFIQTWHGTPLKRIGADIIDNTRSVTADKSEIVERYSIAREQMSYLLSNSKFTSEKFASAFAISSEKNRRKIIEIGNPRNDLLVFRDKDMRARVRQSLGVGNDQTLVLYAPTWRDDQHSVIRGGYVYNVRLDLRRLSDALGEKYVLAVRSHYLVENQLAIDGNDQRILDVSHYQEVNELCLASDILVTDYSSIFFDYLILDRPMIFFAYDMEHYRDCIRGFYLDMESLPGALVRTEEELISAIINVHEREKQESKNRNEANSIFNTFDNGHASESVAEILLGKFDN